MFSLLACLAMMLGAQPTANDKSIPDRAYAEAARQLEVLVKDAGQARRERDNRAAHRVVPRTVNAEGRLVLVTPDDWCSGFFPGTLWMMYQHTGDERWRQEAVSQTWLIEDAKTNRGTHDLGFMMNNSFGKAYEITHEQSYRDVLLQSAQSLISRFNPTVGCIRSWDHNQQVWRFPVIIDNMMNLEMLFRVTQLTGDSTYWNIAVKHAETTMRNHFRSDYSSFHVIDYDPETGQVRARNTAQGNSDDSFWSRGQAWGLYGFTMVYRFTHDKRFLEQARHIADFWLSLPHLPADGIPYWDMKLPSYDASTHRDVSAATLCASALYELSLYVSPDDARRYLQYADKVTTSLFEHYRAEPGSHHGFLLLHSVGHHPADSEVDVPLNYADYYYLEALLRRAAMR